MNYLQLSNGIEKLQSSCNIARATTQSRWAWIDMCCIDQNNKRRGSKIGSFYVYVVPLLSTYNHIPVRRAESGTMARSVWKTRGWTVQEFITPTIVLFYQNNWTMHLDDRCSNHKESVVIMQELADTTGALVTAI